ncbi:PilZ domain-containing protein [Sphingomonas sp. HITSZ_GF]|uniref:PilZ domain-containing protein n=1 Tax=Sphingomonas sp. HITSZ_GF TaxID=3037247 RepID=UPI00240D60B5|nr:PilZ domain-containing protein [Sphingomonas sp. HITSZ_GF]MDG2533088.1 PilZ domain-containing protein [Sphingomonas sp. HITSZ_GF]
MLPRESRREVVIPAQMRSKGGWSDVTIRNISPHGMMLLAPFPPKPGTYVEVRKSSLALVGRVVWVKGKTLGIQLIERLNFNALLRAANEGWAASQVHAPRPEATATDTPAPESRRGTILPWLLAGTTVLLASGCAAVALFQV